MNETISFEEALTFLQTTRSTLYRWLHEGKVPAHKLGRQWRFKTDELATFRDGGAQRQQIQDELKELADFFTGRAKRSDKASKKGETMNASGDTTTGVMEAMIWDAYDRGASDVHLQPRNDGVHIAYRLNGRLEEVRTIGAEAAGELSQACEAQGKLVGRGMLSLFLSRPLENGNAELNVAYQALETLQGKRVTLRFLHHGYVLDLEKVASGKDRETLESWLAEPNGGILFAGNTGSGQTTTLLSCLQPLARDKGQAVFSLEDPVEIQIDGVDQLQVDGRDDRSVDDAFMKIFRSACNAIAIGVDTPAAAKVALHGARTGHLILMQSNAPSAAAALKKFETWVGEPLNDTFVAVCYQVLVPGPGSGRKAKYQLQSSKQST